MRDRAGIAGRRPGEQDMPVVAFRHWTLGLVLVAACAGCGRSATPQASAAPQARVSAGTPQASSTAPVSAGTSPVHRSVPNSTPAARPTASSSVVRRIPAVSAKARAAGLIDIRTVVPDAIIDLRYATSDNFTGVRLYPIDARCLVHQSMAAGLVIAADRLRQAGYLLVFWDCYRPHAVQVRMFQVVPNPDWVARPGLYATSHEAARSVDVTLAHAPTGLQCLSVQRVQGHCLLDMGTGFDDFTPRAYAFATAGVSTQAQSNRVRLRAAMNSGGITVYSGEWWHFDGPGSLIGRPQLDVPLD